jgi:hypothetical protein
MPPARQPSAATSFIEDVADEDLVYIMLNVGDGDSQILVLPQRSKGGRLALVIDAAKGEKLSRALDGLLTAGLIERPPARDRLFPLVCATHPHNDHIAGMGRFLRDWGDDIGEFWEPGYRHPSPAFFDMMNAVERGDFAHAQPASGFTRYLGLVRVTVLTPAIGLRNRFDTYGVDINDASISLKIEFPASRVELKDGTRELHSRRLRKLILGADSLMLSWAQALIDWPELHPDNSEVAKALNKAQGASPLKAHLFKVPHHGSKHGVSVELVEQIGPRLSLLSCRGGGGRFNFPHEVAVEAIREAVEPIATKPDWFHSPDHELGIHSTGDRVPFGKPLGSIAVVIGPKANKWNIWRFGDGPHKPINLADAVPYTPAEPALETHR